MKWYKIMVVTPEAELLFEVGAVKYHLRQVSEALMCLCRYPDPRVKP